MDSLGKKSMAKPKISPPDQHATDGTRRGHPGSQERREIKELITCQTLQLLPLLEKLQRWSDYQKFTRWGVHPKELPNLAVIKHSSIIA
jgi:hypothetical protein